MQRIILFSLILLSALFVHPLVLLPLVFLYAMHWYALEILFLAVLVDGYFHVINEFPAYTAGAFAVILTTEIIKRYLRIV